MGEEWPRLASISAGLHACTSVQVTAVVSVQYPRSLAAPILAIPVHSSTMNKLLCISLCVLAVATTLVAAAPQFTTKYDNVNVDDILKNERLLQKYIDCVLDKGKCTADGQELKNALPEAIKNECAGCSEKQREGAQKVAKFLYEHKKPVWEELLSKYDPDGTFREKYKGRYEEFLKD